VDPRTEMDSTEKSIENSRGVERLFIGHPSPTLLTTFSTHTCLCYSTLYNLINFRRLSIGLLQVLKLGHDHFFLFILFRIQRSCHVESVARCSCVETTSVHGVMYSRNYETHPATTAAFPYCRPSWGCNMTGPLESPSSLRNCPHERGAKSFSVELQVSTK
jgi:hypothetical protein